MNVHCSSRPGKNNSKGNSEIIRAASLVSKVRTIISLSICQMASVQSHRSRVAQRLEGPIQARQSFRAKTATLVGPQNGTSAPVCLEGGTLALRSHRTCLVVWTYLGPLIHFFFPFLPLEMEVSTNPDHLILPVRPHVVLP